MTIAPENLKAVRRLLLDHLDIRENSNAYPTDLDPNEVGIIGDPNHRGGYHCGRDRVDDDDYSVRESSRDRSGLTEAASALDIGQWSTTVAGKRHDLRSMSIWLVAQCKAGAADTRDIREVIYSPDGDVVKRWDRLGKRSSGDSSHRWHTHISYHRDATRAGRDLTALFRRYLTTIGLAAGEDDDMFCQYGQRGAAVKLLQYRLHNLGHSPGDIDSTYGDKTAVALAAAVRAYNGAVTDGRTYGPEQMIYLDVMWSRKYGGGGQPGPAGPPGAPGPAGPPGPAGDVTATVAGAVAEIGRRIVAGAASESQARG
ncbi:hypothetical protein O7626_41120 [Micromonospora sp. WMMD1102]|uniref:peptidoglycan-binding protein n=1 Tax=Micromonospora sp. WMMD1102 TaxID=3016105 RepID=UPI0024154839|nr:peptidoglycan-binding protein [Micromonospora sp. WMMD1102]MDG4784364.1 hypothetical protein [Micromonospora sp. WMMD1102]MDG4784438.1 hypothetical protein [Micromonospora sp. WMMD1102]MDG4792207.1 hypothetical protein [Micromonospora sp. WMMD1102]